MHPTTLRNNAVGQLKTNNGRRGPTAGVVLALQTFIQEFGILVGRSLHIHTFPAPGTPITDRTEAVVHDIDTGSTRPIRSNPRKLSPKKIKIKQELVDKMLEEGHIEHSVSAWCAPTVLVTKKDGSTRFCVDYRRLNAHTKKRCISPAAHRRLIELIEWTSLVYNPRLSQRLLAGETI